MDTVMMALDDIKPYWRNPRRIPEESVNAVAESLRRYGYNQPIVVDAKNVIIIGHTRYSAFRKIGAEQVPVIVSDLPPDKAKELRLIDNKSSEYTSWDYEALVSELESADATLMSSFFPEVSAVEDDGMDVPSEGYPEWGEVDRDVEFICPSCFHSFEITVEKEDIFAGKLEAKP